MGDRKNSRRSDNAGGDHPAGPILKHALGKAAIDELLAQSDGEHDGEKCQPLRSILGKDL